MELLRQGARAMGLSLGPRQTEQFESYYRELAAWNDRFNLTAITGYEEVQTRHFVDSLSCLLAFPQGVEPEPIPNTVPLQRDRRQLRALDIGTGAGFPGIPLKIMRPDLRMTLLEATGKKVFFLEQVIIKLGLTGIDVIQGRAEEAAHWPEHRETYDLVLARAVAHLAVVAEYGLPFCRPGGRLIAPKGEEAHDEAAASETALALLGGRLVAIKQVELPGLGSQRYLVVIDKSERTPERYPRRPGIPAKRPLV